MLVVAGIPFVQPAAAEGEAPEETVSALCGVVKNALGWPISGATVALTLAVGSALTYAQTPAVGSQATTAEDGSFQVAYLENWDRLEYNLVVLPPADPVFRYTPERIPVTPLQHGTAAACPAGTEGRRYDVQLDVAAQSFLEVTVTDALTNAKLSDVTVGFGPTSATTNANGVARLTCATPVGRVVLRATATGYVPALADSPCTAENALTSVSLALWRKPLTLAVSVTQDAAVEGVLEEPQAGAVVALRAKPAELTNLMSSSADCFGGVAGPQGLVDAPFVAAPAPAPAVDPGSPYVCSTTADANGIAILRLPWSAAGAYTLGATFATSAAEEPGVVVRVADAEASPATQGLPTPVVPTVQDSRISAASTRYVWMSLEAVEFVLEGTIVDLAGEPVADAPVNFSGPTIVRVTTDEDGAFTAPLPAGVYDIVIEAEGFAPRACSIVIESTPTNVGVRPGSLSPGYCWTLVEDDAAVLNGRLVDAATSIPLRDASACVGEACAQTDEDGAFTLVLPAAQPLSLEVANGTRWPEAALAHDALAEGAIVDAGDLPLARSTRCVRFSVTSPTESVQSADVEIRAGDQVVSWALSSGQHQVAWSDDPDNVYDAAPYNVHIFRHRAQPWLTMDDFPLAVGPDGECIQHAVDISFEELVPVVITATADGARVPVRSYIVATPIGENIVCHNCTVTLEANASTTLWLGAEHTFFVCATAYGYNATCVERWTPVPLLDLKMPNRFPAVPVRAVDAHTGAALPVRAWVLSSEDGTPPCAQNSQVCEARGDPATLQLATGTYKICAEPLANGYQVRCTGKVVVKAATVEISFSIPRDFAEFTFQAVDAHTGAAIQGAVLEFLPLAPGYVCAPANAGMTCASTATNAQGTAGTASAPAVRVPLLGAGGGCWRVAAMGFAPAASAAMQNTVQNDQGAVGEAWRCDDVTALTNGSAIRIEMVRAALAPIAGSVLSALDGEVPQGVTVTAALRRSPAAPAFECAAEGDANQTFPDCYGVAPDEEDGAFSLTLPTPGALPARWVVTVSAPGFYAETFENVEGGADLGEITLWPTSFDLEITLALGSAGGEEDGEAGCGDARLLTLTVKDLELPGAPIPADFDTGESCTAIVHIPRWNRLNVNAVGAPAAPQKTTDAFLLQMFKEDGGLLVASVEMVGPAARSITVTMIEVPSGVPSGANAAIVPAALAAGGPLPGQVVLGVPGGVLVATRAEGACSVSAPAFVTVAAPAGVRTLALPCAGAYALQVLPLGLVQVGRLPALASRLGAGAW